MVKKDFYNQVLGKLLDEIEADGILKKTDRIACCTNGHSNIARELVARGFNAEEIDLKKFTGDCTVFVSMIRHTDFYQVIEKLPHTTKLLSLYRLLFISEDNKENKKIEEFYIRSIGTTEIMDEWDETTGKKWSEPFDNRVFYYDFGGGKN